ncbi:uncharacterized protein [Choristoneura fumiferana]|uniref:uncharacterized protein n=1 Tax=Choristoneura fumiferana TaxID=7141 RepID=UPI003D1587A7
MADLLEKDYSKWNSEDFKAYAINIIIATCTLIEKQQKGLGGQTLDQYLEILSKYNENKQFPDLSYARQEISDIINTVHKPNGKLEIKALTFFAKGLTDVVSKEKILFSDLVSLKLPGVLEDGFSSLTVVGRVVGGIIDNAIPGLGKLLDNLVTAVGKIFACYFGSSGHDTPYICQKDYLSGYGYHDIDTCSSKSDIIEFYNVTNSKEQAFKYINEYTKGKGVKALSVNEKIVCERMLLIAGMLDNDCNEWSSEDLKAYAINIVAVSCVIFESQQRALGRYALDEYLVALSKYNKNKQFPDFSGSKQQIYDIIGKVQLSTWNGAYRTTYVPTYTETTDELFPSLQIFANGLPDSLGNVKKLLADVGYIKLIGGLYDAFALFVTGRGVGGVINILIPGLGDLFSNLSIAIGKIFVCTLGPDAKKHFLCYQDYLSKYGYNDIASCSSASEILEFYKVKNATQQAPKFINEYTKGKGVESLSVTEKLIYERVTDVASLIEKDYTKWTSQDLKEFTFSVVVMTCIVVESQQKGLARGALDEYIPALVKYNTAYQFPDLTDITPAVYDIINEVQPSSCNTASKIKDSIGSLTLVAAN